MLAFMEHPHPSVLRRRGKPHAHEMYINTFMMVNTLLLLSTFLTKFGKQCYYGIIRNILWGIKWIKLMVEQDPLRRNDDVKTVRIIAKWWKVDLQNQRQLQILHLILQRGEWGWYSKILIAYFCVIFRFADCVFLRILENRGEYFGL